LPWQVAEKQVLRLILGGAAVHRCVKCIVLNSALAAGASFLLLGGFFRKLFQRPWPLLAY